MPPMILRAFGRSLNGTKRPLLIYLACPWSEAIGRIEPVPDQ
jgi:hypothetical protein